MSLTDLVKGVQRLARPLVLGLAEYACGGGGETKYCQKYVDMCPQNASDLKECQSYCEQQGKYDFSKRDCAFIACAVETGYCDNEVEGDPQIIDCVESHGW